MPEKGKGSTGDEEDRLPTIISAGKTCARLSSSLTMECIASCGKTQEGALKSTGIDLWSPSSSLNLELNKVMFRVLEVGSQAQCVWTWWNFVAILRSFADLLQIHNVLTGVVLWWFESSWRVCWPIQFGNLWQNGWSLGCEFLGDPWGVAELMGIMTLFFLVKRGESWHLFLQDDRMLLKAMFGWSFSKRSRSAYRMVN